MSRLTHPVETLAAAVYHAAHSALPDHSYEMVDHAEAFKLSSEARKEARAREARGEVVLPRKLITHRPDVSQCEVVAMFPQTWGSTSLGFGGLAGQAVTVAYTVVIQGPDGHRAVYWGGRFAYLVDVKAQTPQQRAAFEQDLQVSLTAARCDAGERYGVAAPAEAGDIADED